MSARIRENAAAASVRPISEFVHHKSSRTKMKVVVVAGIIGMLIIKSPVIRTNLRKCYILHYLR